MPEDMTAGEVGRTLQRIERDTSEFKRGFDGWREILIELRHQVAENTKDIAEINKERAEEAKQRKKDRQWLIAAMIVPGGVVLLTFGLQTLLNLSGALS